MEIIIIILLILIQSIFGIGLLLFGTPTFIFLGYNFADTLSLLLPISIFISFLQIIFSKKKNKKYIKEFNLYCIPFLVLSTYLILNYADMINFNIFISSMILIIFFMSLFKNIFVLNKFSSKLFLILIGIIHGLSNLSGSLLSLMAIKLNENDKVSSRFFISYGYFTMASFQYLVLLILRKNHFDLNN